MYISQNKLRKLIIESLKDQLKADYIVGDDVRTFNQVSKAYTEWTQSDDARLIVSLIRNPDPDYRAQADELLAALSDVDPNIPPDTIDFEDAYNAYIVSVGNIVLDTHTGLSKLLRHPDPETEQQRKRTVLGSFRVCK